VEKSLLDDATSLTGALQALAERFPEFRCLTIVDRQGTETQIALSQLWERARAVHAVLREAGLERGGVVILIMPTGADLVSAYFGAMLAGGIPGLVATPSNRLSDHHYYAERVSDILANAGAQVLFCSPEIARIFDGPHKQLLGRARLIESDTIPASIAEPPQVKLPAADDTATIQYSSGSTGTPKGTLLSHRAMLNNIRYVRDGLGLGPADVSVNWIPLYHDMGLIDAFLLPLLSGSPTVLIPTMDFMADPSLWLWAVDRYRGALSWAPNFAYSVCAKRVTDAEIEGLDLSSWRVAINAAEPVLPHTIETFTERFARYGFKPEAMTPAWGLAENVTIATAHPTGERPRIEHIDRQALARENVARPVEDVEALPSIAIGKCLPHCDIQIRDHESDEPLSDRTVGRVWLRSNSLFHGYHKAPDQTSAVLREGWLDTGDDGYMADGDLFFVSRAKDLIIIGGDKYAPHDIETLINEVDGVRKGCVVSFGVMNDKRGTEEIAAVIETRETDDERREVLVRAARKQVIGATGMPLRHVILVPPGGVVKTSSGKLARRATRERHRDQLPS
jgi:acyl-CoA synthetase (AMP-forming)/AMP-acid ligase II